VAGATALKPAFFKAKNIGPLMTPFSLDTQIQWFLWQRQKFCTTFRGGAAASFFNISIPWNQIINLIGSFVFMI
jgi:hypothetical protein